MQPGIQQVTTEKEAFDTKAIKYCQSATNHQSWINQAVLALPKISG